jgi:peptidoglycan/LPS O-acetylase OafA/YrhL
MNTNSLGYIRNFDGLRAIAVLFVLLIHGSYGFFKGGWIGVDLFFVLSGFLITTLLKNDYLNNKRISILKFYIRRFLRLLPALILCIVLAYMLNMFSVAPKLNHNGFSSLAALFYFNNVIDIKVSGNLSHLWSLSVEEHFYLFWPLFLSYFFLRVSIKSQNWFIFSIIIAITIIKIVCLRNNFVFQKGIFVIDTHRFTLFRIDSLLIGALVAMMSTKFNNTLKVYNKTAYDAILVVLGGVFTFLLFKLSIDNIFYKNGGFFLINILCALLIFISAKIPDHFILSNKLLCWIGTRSYGIYIYHFPIFMFFEDIRIASSVFNFLLITFLRVVTTLLIAGISYSYVEKPFLNLKSRFSVR